MIPRNLVTPIAIGAVALSLATYFLPTKKERTPIADRPMTARLLPGFTIDLPLGSKDAKANFDYVAGSLDLQLGGDALLKIGWQYGTLPEEAGLLDLGRALAKSLREDPSKVRIVPNESTPTVAFSGDKYMSITPCGMRLVMVASMQIGWPAHAKIVKSIVCHPDPERENGEAAIPLAIDLLEYQATVRLPGQLTLESPTGQVYMRRVMSDPRRMKITPELGEAFLKANGLTGTFGPPHGEILTFTAKFDEGDEPGRLRMFACDKAKILLAALAVDEPAVADLEKRIAAAHCLAPGEAAPTWPDAPAVLEDELDEELEKELEGSAMP